MLPQRASRIWSTGYSRPAALYDTEWLSLVHKLLVVDRQSDCPAAWWWRDGCAIQRISSPMSPSLGLTDDVASDLSRCPSDGITPGSRETIRCVYRAGNVLESPVTASPQRSQITVLVPLARRSLVDRSASKKQPFCDRSWSIQSFRYMDADRLIRCPPRLVWTGLAGVRRVAERMTDSATASVGRETVTG